MSIVPDQAQASATQNSSDDRRADRPADRRRRRLDDLERRRQEGELVAARACARRSGIARRSGDDVVQRTSWIPACRRMSDRVAAAGPDQLVMGAVLDEATALDGDDAVGRAAPSTAGGR